MWEIILERDGHSEGNGVQAGALDKSGTARPSEVELGLLLPTREGPWAGTTVPGRSHGQEDRLSETPGSTQASHGSHDAHDKAPLLSPGALSRQLSAAAGHQGFGGASKSSAVFNLSTTIVGAGIMALPATMRVLGLPLGLTVIVVMGLLSEASIEMMIKSSTGRQAWSYSELVESTCGSAWKTVLQILILINNVGICIVYLIIVADVVAGTASGSGGGGHPGLLESWFGGPYWWTSRSVVLVATSVFILAPLAAQKHVDSLKYTSAIAIALAVVFLLITAGIAAIKFVQGRLEAPRMLPHVSSLESILQLCSIVPVMSNAFICHFNVHPIYVELRERSEAAMVGVARLSLLLCTAVYVATSLAGYLLFGERTAPDVLVNFDRDLGVPFGGAASGVVRVTYALHVVLVFPLVHFALRQNADELLFPRAARALVDDAPRFAGITAVQMAAILLGAALVPDIWIAFQFTGATSAVSIGFIFPALVALRHVLPKTSLSFRTLPTLPFSDKTGVIQRGAKKLARLMLVLAVIVSVAGIASSTFNVINNFRTEIVSVGVSPPPPMQGH
eukprot:jgi/Mesen1/10523/ME000083S10032